MTADIEQRLNAIERYLTSQNPAWNARTVPIGTSGSLSTSVPAQPIAQIVVDVESVNIRARPAKSDRSVIMGQMLRGQAMTVIEVVDDEDGTRDPEGKVYQWYNLGSLYVRNDVVRRIGDWSRFGLTAQAAPAPTPPVSGDLWPAPVTGYSITNTHLNERNHHGIDYAAALGTPVRVGPPGGVVVKVYACVPCGLDATRQSKLGDLSEPYGFGYGNYVIVRYSAINLPEAARRVVATGFVFTLYAHLSRMNVVAGQVLRGPEEIGKVGSSGNSSGPHLHVECRVSGQVTADWYAIRNAMIDPDLIFKA